MTRVLAGRFKGRRLEIPTGVGTRPSAVRLRASLFSLLTPRIEGQRVVDLFAGSGAQGIEALSRGAAHATFVELDPRALRVIGANLRVCGVDPARFRVRRADAWRWLARQEAVPPSPQPPWILADPPWTGDFLDRLLPLAVRLVDSGHVRGFVLEHPAPAGSGLPAGGRVRADTRIFGRASFTILQRDHA